MLILQLASLLCSIGDLCRNCKEGQPRADIWAKLDAPLLEKLKKNTEKSKSSYHSQLIAEQISFAIIKIYHHHF